MKRPVFGMISFVLFLTIVRERRYELSFPPFFPVLDRLSAEKKVVAFALKLFWGKKKEALQVYLEMNLEKPQKICFSILQFRHFRVL